MGFEKYYEVNYGLKISNKKQPLLKAVLSGKKTKQEAFIVPEFLLMPGFPDDFDERKRRMISEFTNIEPQERMNRIQGLISSFNKESESENMSPNKLSNSLGIKLAS